MSVPPHHWRPARVVKGDGYHLKQGETQGQSSLVFDQKLETKMLRDVKDTWQQSSRCCPESCGPRCGLVILCRRDVCDGQSG